MKKILFVAFITTFAILTAFCQRRIDPAKQIYLAPDRGYILLSDENGELQFTLLDTISTIGGGGVDTLVDVGDGRYFYIAGDSGDTTLIDTRANALPTTVSINIGGTNYNAGTTVQEILIALANYNRANFEGDTITQNGHGLFVGDMVGQTSGGTFFKASSDAPANFPVAFVSQVLSANQFVIRNEGWLTWSHGRTLYRDYFLQADGTFGTSPDTNYNIFAFRTFKNNKAYFDVPELIVKDTTVTGDGSGGGGGITRYTRVSTAPDQSGLTVTTVGVIDSVGLDITLLPISTTINNTSYAIVWDSINNRNVRVPITSFDTGGGGGNTTVAAQAPNRQGLAVQTVSGVDSVGVNISILPSTDYSSSAGLNFMVWDSINNRNVRVPRVSFPSYSANAGSGLTNTGNASNASIRLGGSFSHEPQFVTNGFATRWIGTDSTASNASIDLLSIRNPSATGLGGGVSFFNGKHLITRKNVYFNAVSDIRNSSLFIDDFAGINIQGSNTGTGRTFQMYQFGDAIEMYVDSVNGNNLVDVYRFDLGNTGVSMGTVKPGGSDFRSLYANANEAGILATTIGGSVIKEVKVTTKTVVMTGIPQYADDTAADADSTLPSGGIYKVAGDRSLRIKP